MMIKHWPQLSSLFQRLYQTSMQKSMSNSKSSLSATLKNLKVEHDARDKKFYVQIGKDHAVILYEKIDNHSIDLFHTEVPPAFRGQGIAAVLAKAAFDYVLVKDLKMKLSCDYLQKYYRENASPEMKHTLI